MPTYFPIKRWMDAAEKARTAERQKLKSEITDRAERNSLFIAMWNLRDFDSNRLGHGPRLQESNYYIAEIVSALGQPQYGGARNRAVDPRAGLGLHRHRYDRGQDRGGRADGGPRDYYVKQWRTWQMSDHLPLWAELKVDFFDHYLDAIRKTALQS